MTREALHALDAERRRIIEDTIGRVAREAPNAALERMVQYGASLPSIDAADADDAEDAFERSARRLIEWSAALALVFERLAAREATNVTLYDAVRLRLIAHARRISRVLAERDESGRRPGPSPQISSSA